MTQAALSDTGNERIKPGGNFPPFEQARQEIEDLHGEALCWLDGSFISTQAEADEVAKLLDMTRKARKKADEARKEENRPFDEGKAEVQARYNPILKMADLIIKTCKDVNEPWLIEQDNIKREAERIAREEAEAAERAAQEAMQRSSGNIEEREQAEAALEAAKQATANANKLAKDKGHAKGGDRAMSLRTTYRPELADLSAAIEHYWSVNRAEFEALVCDLAAKDVRAGKREIPGFIIHEEKKAV